MSVATNNSDERKDKTISANVRKEFADEFDMALKKAQVEGHIDLNASRSEAIRRLMKAAVEDPSLFSQDEE